MAKLSIISDGTSEGTLVENEKGEAIENVIGVYFLVNKDKGVSEAMIKIRNIDVVIANVEGIESIESIVKEVDEVKEVN